MLQGAWQAFSSTALNQQAAASAGMLRRPTPGLKCLTGSAGTSLAGFGSALHAGQQSWVPVSHCSPRLRQAGCLPHLSEGRGKAAQREEDEEEEIEKMMASISMQGVYAGSCAARQSSTGHGQGNGMTPHRGG